ncbi:MAG: hypothetical protein AAGD18_20315 [Actinomycetota bacterium]
MDIVIAFSIPIGLTALLVAVIALLRRRNAEGADEALRRIGLRPVDNAERALDRFAEVERSRRVESNVTRLVGLDVGLFSSISTVALRPKRAWVARDLQRSGIVGAFKVNVDSSTSAFLTRTKSTSLDVQVIVARLPFTVAERLTLVPHHLGFDPQRVESALAVLERIGPQPRALDDDVLGRWWLALDGGERSETVRTDRRLRALLWALRTKVSGAGEHISDRERAELEAMFPDVPRTQGFEHVIVDGDVLVLVGQAGAPWNPGMSQRYLDIAAAVCR